MPDSDTKLFHSVIFQLLLAMALMAGMALASMGMSVYVTMDTEDDAEAINLAGSLRMQSYRISNILSRAIEGEIQDPRERLEQERLEFSEKLYRSTIPQVINRAGNTPLDKSYQQVLDNWKLAMEPLLLAARNGDLSWWETNRRYNQQLGQYVQHIDDMVTHLQRDSEGKIELLGMTEGISIILIIFIMVFLVMKADENLVVPLRNLVQAARAVERGHLDHRISFTSDNELGLLSQTFNNMIESLEAQYRTLEEQVAERTEELRRSNQTLYFLYKTSREIASSPYNPQLLQVFLQELKKVADVASVNLCVTGEPNYLNYDFLSSETENDRGRHGNCADYAMTPEHLARSGEPGLSLPLQSRNDVYGFLYVRSRMDEKLLPWQNQLLHTVAETLSTAFAFHHTLGQEQRLILLEERSTIARELHDSLAQSLSYMKMETARLQKLIERGFEPARIEDALSDLQGGINAAYKHLRELLVTFRIKLDAPDLRSAMEHAVQEFDEQGPAAVRLEYGLDGQDLGPNGDIHVLHIVREALNNAVKHAKASEITLRCARTESGDIEFTVEDNGIGISEAPEKQHHYGLYTMRERARQLEGRLTCTRRASGGTRVQLRVAGVTGLLHA